MQTYKGGRLPQLPEGQRLAINYVHEYFGQNRVVYYPLDVSQGIVEWLMLGNGPDPTLTIPLPSGDSAETGVGDCVPCAWQHDLMIAIAQGKLGGAPTANGTVGVYLEYDDNQDNGVVIAAFLLWLYQNGTIAGFAPVALDQIDATMAQFNRGVILGVNLTDQNESQFPNEWTEGPGNLPDPNMGHGVLKVKAEQDGTGSVVSWGQGVEASQSWFSACVEEAWLILTPDDKAALAPDQWNALVADLNALPNAHDVPTTTPPAPTPPTPAPTPPAPAPPPPPVPLPPRIQHWWEEVLEWIEENL